MQCRLGTTDPAGDFPCGHTRMRGVNNNNKSGRADFKLLLVVLAAAVTLGWLTAAFSHLNNAHGEEQVTYSHEQHGCVAWGHMLATPLLSPLQPPTSNPSRSEARGT